MESGFSEKAPHHPCGIQLTLSLIFIFISLLSVCPPTLHTRILTSTKNTKSQKPETRNQKPETRNKHRLKVSGLEKKACKSVQPIHSSPFSAQGPPQQQFQRTDPALHRITQKTGPAVRPPTPPPLPLPLSLSTQLVFPFVCRNLAQNSFGGEVPLTFGHLVNLQSL